MNNKIDYPMLIFFGIFLLLFIFVFCLILFDHPEYEDDKIVKGDCYDRYGNKINDVTCDIIEKGYKKEDKYLGLCVCGFFIFIFSSVFYITLRRDKQ